MKSVTPVLALLFCVVQALNADGLLTNTGQSTQFTRMPSRNASLQIDGVFYNPAGLTRLSDGLHIGFYNMAAFGKNEVISGYPLLNNGEYPASISTIFNPSLFAVYKKSKIAFSLGYIRPLGMGPVKANNGLASFEIPVSRVVAELEGLNSYGYDISAYDADISYLGKSAWSGFQAGVTYELFTGFSVSAGARVVMGSEAIDASVTNVQVNVNGTFEDAPDYLTVIGNDLKSVATSYSGLVSRVQTIITLGAGSYTIAQVQTAGFITSAERSTWEAALSRLGFTSAQIAGMNINTVRTNYATGAYNYNMQGTLALYQASALEDNYYESSQSGLGLTPFIAINYSYGETLNIALKYEHKTSVKILENSDPEGPSLVYDIPAIVSAGLGIKPFGWLETQLSFNLYFDKKVDWGFNLRNIIVNDEEVVRSIDRNSFEVGLGLQFKINEKVTASTGFNALLTGVNDDYQSDFYYSIPLINSGLGIQYKINDNLTLDAGLMHTLSLVRYPDFTDTRLQQYYNKYPEEYSDPEFQTGIYSDKLKKSGMMFSIGLSYSLDL